MIVEKLHDDNWHNCKWTSPHPNAFFFSQITSKILKKHKIVMVKDSLTNISKEILTASLGKNIFFPYSELLAKKHPNNNYYYIQKTRFLDQEKKRGGVFVFAINDKINSFALFTDSYQNILKDKCYDKSRQPYVYINSHLVKDPLDQIQETQQFLDLFEKNFGHFHFIDHYNPLPWKIDYHNYKIYDLGSEKTVYYNTLYLQFLSKNGNADGFNDGKELSIRNRPEAVIYLNQDLNYEVVLLPNLIMAKKLKPIEYQFSS